MARPVFPRGSSADRGESGDSCCAGLSGFRELTSEDFESDGVGLGTAAPIVIQARDFGHLIGRQLEVEGIDVLCDAAGPGGLRDHRGPRPVGDGS